MYISSLKRMKNNLNLLLIATVILLLPVSSHPRQLTSSLFRGSALSVENDSDKLVSPNRVFTCGFMLIGANAYTFSIWFTNSADKTKVWTAMWGLIVNGKGSLLTFQKDGGIVLTDIDGTVVWSTNTTSSQANQMKLLDSGNLVVTDSENTLWQSFDYPTDTLLPHQPITRYIKLVSSKNNGLVDVGYYSFYFDNDNVLRMLYDGPDTSSIYWPNPNLDAFQNHRTIFNSSRYGVLDEFGQFTASDRFSFKASDKGLGIIRRLTLDSDGNLRLYSLNSSSGTWLVTWIAFERLCNVHGLCGKNGLCLYTQSRVTCSCPPNYEASDPSDWNKGCKPKFNISCQEPNSSTTFVKIPHSDFWGKNLDYINNSVSLQHCKNLCKSKCTCEAIQYINGIGRCFTKTALFNGKSSILMKGSIYFKVPKNARMSRGYELKALHLSCNNISEVDDVGSTHLYKKKGSKINWVYFYGFVAALGLIEILFGILGWCFVYKRGINASLAEQGYELMGRQFRKFTFKELRKATQNFKEVIGMGGSGTVYKGKLEDERGIAVKKLKDLIQGEEEFWAEVSTIGRIYHMNLVKLLGFCFEGSRRLLVSEYVDFYGSLDNHLFIGDTPGKVLGWKERFKIVLGTARGLAYLHEECLEWVIHCDVKPENILLESDFEPKIADFGLAKLLKRGAIGSRISHIRGTRGYMAPEWALNLPITSKIDVFGYGVVLLEIVKGKRISDWTVEGEKQSYEDMRMMVRMLNEKHEIQESWVCYFVDPNLGAEFDQKQAKAMVEIALSCVEEDRNRRPSMNSIVEFLLTHES